MLKLFSFLVLFSIGISCSYTSYACSFKKGTSVVSLSGPVTLLFEKLQLLEQEELKAISIFHPVNFKKKKYGGGIFLSQKSLKELKGKVVFFDFSHNFQKQLIKYKVQKVSIETRGLGVFEAIDYTYNKVEPFLKGCHKKMLILKEKHKRLKQLLSKVTGSYLFYLGKVDRVKKPQMLMVNDGLVKTLLTHSRISSYPTKLSYVNWSSRIIKKMQKAIHIGLVAKGHKKMVKLGQKKYNIYGKQILIPGFGQLEALEVFVKIFNELKI